MSASKIVQARISGDIKDEAGAVLAEMGLSISDAVRMLLTRIAREKTLPFTPFTPNETTIRAMQDVRAGKVKRADSLQQLMADLHAPD